MKKNQLNYVASGLKPTSKAGVNAFEFISISISEKQSGVPYTIEAPEGYTPVGVTFEPHTYRYSFFFAKERK